MTINKNKYLGIYLYIALTIENSNKFLIVLTPITLCMVFMCYRSMKNNVSEITTDYDFWQSNNDSKFFFILHKHQK